MTILPELLSTKDTARLIGVSERTLLRWHSVQTGPARIRVGRKVLYRLKAVYDWLRANEISPARTFAGDSYADV